MSRTVQILLGVVAFFFVILVLVPMLPTEFYIQTIVLVGVVIAAIIWILSLVGINLP